MCPLPRIDRSVPVDLHPHRPSPPPARRQFSMAEQLTEVANPSINTSRRRPLPDSSSSECVGKRSRLQPETHLRCRPLATQILAYRNGWTTARVVLDLAALNLRESVIQRGGSGVAIQKVFEQLKSQLNAAGLQPDLVLYTTAITVAVGSNEMSTAWALLAEMQGHNPPVAPDIRLFNVFLRVYSQSGDFEGIRNVLREMASQHPRVQPDRISYRLMIDAHAAAENGDTAEKLLKEMIRRAQDNPSLRPDWRTWIAAIKAYEGAGDGKSAERLFLELKAQDTPPERFDKALELAVTTVIHAYAKAGDGRNAERWLRNLSAQVPPIRPDMINYSAVIHTYKAAGDWEAVERLFQELPTLNPPLVPDLSILNAMFMAYGKLGNREGAERLLGELENLSQVVPSSQSRHDFVKEVGMIWMHVFHMYVVADDPDGAARILHRMKAQKPLVGLNGIHYFQVVSAFQKAGRTAEASRIIKAGIASGDIERGAGYRRDDNHLDFHFKSVLASGHKDADHSQTMSRHGAIALLNYHRDRGHIDRQTVFIVGRGEGLIRNAILRELNRDGPTYIQAPHNSGRLIPARLVAEARAGHSGAARTDRVGGRD